MSHTQLSQSKSRRDLAGSLRGSRTRKHARLRHRRLQAERLEDRRLLAGDFELSSLLPANGGDGTSGFVIDGITDRGKIGGSSYGSQQLGDVNQDGIDDFYLAAPGVYGTINTLSQSYIIFGRAEWQGSFPAELDLGTLTTLNGTSRSGYVIDGVVPGDLAGSAGGGAGDINGDGISDIISGARFNESYRSLVLFGGSENLAALDLADGDSDGHIELSTFDTAPDVTHGFAINGSGGIQGVGDVNGDQVDDWEVSNGVLGWFVVYGRDSTQGNFFPAVFEPSSLLSSNGGDGSNGFVIPRVAPTYMMFGSVRNAGDVNNDGIGDIIYAEPQAMPLGRSEAGQAWVIFGQTSFPATFDLASLNGSNGFTVYGKTYDGLGMWRGGTAGDVNGDSVDDLVIPAWGIDGLGGSNVGGAMFSSARTLRRPVHSRPSSRFPPSMVQMVLLCTGSRRATTPALLARQVTSTATATTTSLSPGQIRPISFTVGRVLGRVSNSRACWLPTAAMGRQATSSTGRRPMSPGLATSTTTALPTFASRYPTLTPTGLRTTARCMSSTANLRHP